MPVLKSLSFTATPKTADQSGSLLGDVEREFLRGICEICPSEITNLLRMRQNEIF